MHSECNAGKFCYLHQQLAFRYVAAVHGALCKYAHIPFPCLKLQIYCLHLILQFAWTIGGQPSVIVLWVYVHLWAFLALCALWISCFEALSLLEFNVRLSLYKNMNTKVHTFLHGMLEKKKILHCVSMSVCTSTGQKHIQLLNQLITGAMYHLWPAIQEVPNNARFIGSLQRLT